LQATEMWFLRRMLTISWTDMVSNKAVLRHANTDRQLMWNILSRQLRFVGHVLRKEKLEEIAVTCRIEAKRSHHQDASDSHA